MDSKPVDIDSILEDLDKFYSKDLKYAEGHILGSMCTQPHPFAIKVFNKFINSNLGDPGLFKGTFEMEQLTIKSIGNLLSLDEPYGNIVTGGTEANLMAVRAAKNSSSISKGEIILSKSAHFSFKKAIDMMDLKAVEIPLDKSYKMDVDLIEESITENTIAIIAVAGTTELGLIDNISEIAKIARKYGIYLHVDAAFGGFSIPLLNENGFNLPNFDFSIEGVCSITIDPHKFCLVPIPAGCIIFREKKYLNSISVDSPYLTIKHQSTIVGTRLGASTAATYAMLKYFAREGYFNIIKELMDNTYFLKEALIDLGYEIVTEPELNIVAFNHPKISAYDFEKILIEKGWFVSVSSYPVAIRIVLMTHIKKENLEEFLKDLKNLI